MNGMPSSGTTYRRRQPDSPTSARGSSHTAMPDPRAAVRASTLTVHAREFRGTSSAARMPMSSASAVDRPRATVWLTPSSPRFGASAPVAVHGTDAHRR